MTLFSRNEFLSLMAKADAFGMKYEFVDHPIPVDKGNLFYGPHPRHHDYQERHYSDDTQMSLANAELLLKKKDLSKITKLDFIRAWQETFKRDPRVGYSKYMYAQMSSDMTPKQFCEKFASNTGTTSGAAMRAAPFGLIEDFNLAINLASEQASITHNSPAGRFSASVVTAAVHFLHHGGHFDYLQYFLENTVTGRWLPVWKDPQCGLVEDPNNGLKIVGQALAATEDKKSLAEVFLSSVSQSRVADTDTIATMAAAISSRRQDIIDDLPLALHDTLENGPYGRDYLGEIDKKLMKTFPPSTLYTKRLPFMGARL